MHQFPSSSSGSFSCTHMLYVCVRAHAAANKFSQGVFPPTLLLKSQCSATNQMTPQRTSPSITLRPAMIRCSQVCLSEERDGESEKGRDRGGGKKWINMNVNRLKLGFPALIIKMNNKYKFNHKKHYGWNMFFQLTCALLCACCFAY